MNSLLWRAVDTVDGQNPAPRWNHGKPLFVGIYRGIIIPGFLGGAGFPQYHWELGQWSVYQSASFIGAWHSSPPTFSAGTPFPAFGC